MKPPLIYSWGINSFLSIIQGFLVNFPFFREITPPRMDLFLAGTIFRDFSRLYPFQGEASLKLGTPFLTPIFLRGIPHKKGKARNLGAPVIYQIKSESGIMHPSLGRFYLKSHSGKLHPSLLRFGISGSSYVRDGKFRP